jgi:hypothetical protein
MDENKSIEIPRIDRETIIMERLRLDGARVIDIGCGEGWLTQCVAARSESVIGIDPSTTALARAQAENNASNATYLLASAENLPLEPSSVDIVVFYNSLHHVPAAVQSKAIEETARVLVQGGVLCFVEPVASGACYELFKPVEDETAVYASSQKLIQALGNGIEFQQLQEEFYLTSYTYRDFDQFLDNLLVVDERRTALLGERRDLLQSGFDSLGEAVEAGRRFDQVHRLNLLSRL